MCSECFLVGGSSLMVFFPFLQENPDLRLGVSTSLKWELLSVRKTPDPDPDVRIRMDAPRTQYGNPGVAVPVRIWDLRSSWRSPVCRLWSVLRPLAFRSPIPPYIKIPEYRCIAIPRDKKRLSSRSSFGRGFPRLSCNLSLKKRREQR